MSFHQPAASSRASSRVVHKLDRGLKSLVLAVVLALGSIPTAAWAKGASPSSAEVARTRPANPTSPAPTTADARAAQRQAYASREASAASQANFKGGDSVVWIGGSTVVIVLLVVLLVVLL